MKTYVRNVVRFSLLGERYYFIPKAEVLGGGIERAVGKKIDVTDSVKRLVESARPIELKPRRARKGRK